MIHYKDHPLLRVSINKHSFDQPKEDMTPKDAAPKSQTGIAAFFDLLRKYIYPLKNSFERKKVISSLELLNGFKRVGTVPDVVSKGHKGFSQKVFLSRIRSSVTPAPETIVCYGCGTGDEAITLAQIFRPRKIIGLDYFNYRSYWDKIGNILRNKYSIEADFIQMDPLQQLPDKLKECCDMIYSHAVLEHVRDMDQTFPFIKGLMKKDAFFLAQWGPMWYSYSGDHISGELGLDKGYEHILLNPEQYFDYYKNHPRNVEDVAKGVNTWMELGLHNFALYSEYIQSLEKYFGKIQFLQWVIAPEAFSYREKFKDNWEKALAGNPEISELDLVLQCAGVVIKNSNA